MLNSKIFWTGVVVIVIIILFLIIRPFSLTVFDAITTDNKPSVTPIALDFVETDENADTMNNGDSQADPSSSTSRLAIEVIGQSAGGNDITAYTFGSGKNEILLVAGIHGGYSWNTSQLAYEVIDYLSKIENELIEARVTVIPLLNPDGLGTVFGTTGQLSSAELAKIPADTVAGRFNDNNVDLNRNFDCQWSQTGVWQNRSVSGGNEVFSEPESQALRAYVEKHKPNLVIAYYSAAGGVYASSCNNGVSLATKNLLEQYGKTTGYNTYESYDYYATTGDMANWFAKIGIPAISVLLSNHTNTELSKNQAGLNAVIKTQN